MTYSKLGLLVTTCLLISSLSLTAGNKRKRKPLITPVMDTKIPVGTNVVYCPSFQFSWNEFKKLAGGDIRMENEHDWVDMLNKSEITTDIVSDKNLIARAGFSKDGVLEKIRHDLWKKFHKRFSQIGYQPMPSSTFTFFSYLNCNLEFPKKLARFNQKSLTFGVSKKEAYYVESFGCHRTYNSGKNGKIRHYDNKDEFCLQLATKNKLETIVLTKMPTPKNLHVAVERTKEHLAEKWMRHKSIERNGKKRSMAMYITENDTLAIPVLKFSLTNMFPEFCGKAIKNNPLRGKKLARAFLKVNFKMDESGVKLQSVAGGDDFGGEEGKPRNFLFDKPFLVSLWKEGADTPYLAVWVANPEFMKPVKK